MNKVPTMQVGHAGGDLQRCRPDSHHVRRRTRHAPLQEPPLLHRILQEHSCSVSAVPVSHTHILHARSRRQLNLHVGIVAFQTGSQFCVFCLRVLTLHGMNGDQGKAAQGGCPCRSTPAASSRHCRSARPVGSARSPMALCL